MPDNDNGCGTAVAEITAPTELAKGFTLFQIEESLVLLAESAEEEGLTPEIERALTVYLEGAAEKRDRVADFIRFCEGMAELAKAEGKRLQARQKHFEATAERVSAMVLRVLDYLGVKKLEGRTNTLKKRKCPLSVKIIDDAKVPAEFKHITVTLPLPQWQELLAGSREEFRKAVLSGIRKQETSVELEAIKQALNLEKTVEGADLVINRFKLQVV
jgi:Siphovirus Gp157